MDNLVTKTMEIYSGKQFLCYNTLTKFTKNSVFNCVPHSYTNIPLYSSYSMNDCQNTCVHAGYNSCVYSNESHSLTCL